MDRKTRRSIKKAQMAASGFAQEVDELKIRAQIAERDLNEAKASISQLEANTEVLMTKALPLPTPEPKNAPAAF